MPWIQTKPVIDYGVRELCFRRYPDHPSGCPNYGRRPTCPPECKLLHEVIDLDKPVYVVWSVFDLGVHVDRMRTRHPGWSDRQLRCCLYWQPKARKKLWIEIVHCSISIENGGMKGHLCPEAMGVNVTETMKLLGEILEWPPVTKTYQVALVGYPKKVGR